MRKWEGKGGKIEGEERVKLGEAFRKWCDKGRGKVRSRERKG